MLSTTPLPLPAQLQSDRNRRAGERIPATMPLTVDGAEWKTQDLSATGLSFAAERPYELGTHIEVVIDYLLDGHAYPLACQAEVMRVERNGEGYTIGARLLPLPQLQDTPTGLP